jgi:cyclopropane fatty-acyl-phospholipid synthase-like methyltransferase
MLNTPEDEVRKFIELQYKEGNSKNIQVLCQHTNIVDIFNRIQSQWISVGDREPYASVLSDEKYSSKNIENNLVEFHETGQEALKNLIALCRKNEVDLPNRVLFELGCGVGRSTQYFAPAFEKICAWDISKGNIFECEKNLASKKILNVKLKLIQQLQDYDSIPEHDVFFSEIVLQHNPPPLQYFLIDKILSKLNRGGVFFFQTITHHETYSFDVSSYLNWQHSQDFEMHALPMRWVLKLLRKNDIFLMDVLKERLGGFNLDSYTFFGVKQS